VLFIVSQCCDVHLIAQALSPTEITEQAAPRLKGKILALRHLTPNSTIKYDEAGTILGKAIGGDWTLHSDLEVTSILHKDQTLYITGNRLSLSFEAWKSGSRTPWYLPTSEEIEIQIKTSKSSTFDLDKQLQKAFLTRREDLPENLPPYWERFLRCESLAAADCPHKRPQAAEISSGGKVNEPNLKKMKQPSYSSAARNRRLEGQVQLLAVVDKTGRVSYVEVIQPLGLGLEERAVEAVRKWIFEPGTIDGLPGAVSIRVMVNFSFK
jgi:TonB family protein